MQYMLLIYSNENGEAEGDEQDILRRYGAFTEDVRSNGKLVTADRLKPTSDATTVRIRNGETLVTDGPFAETKEQIAGYDVIDCADLDEAIAIAARHPVAAWGTIEIRPFWTD